MTKTIIATALAMSLGLGLSAYAQSPAVGGSAAKGNAPLKAMHQVNDGSAKPGANSFTEGQARQHILNSGYTGVSGLAKGQDGVWRGMAMHAGTQVSVAMDFKGNVTEATAPGSGPAMDAGTSSNTSATAMGAGAGGSAAAGGMATGMAHHHHHFMRHHHHHRMQRCSTARSVGAACSGVSSSENGISDKENRAIAAGAKP